MRSPQRALLYGLGVWVGLIVVSLILLPLEGSNEPLYESLKSSALAAIALGFTIRYLSKQPASSWREGVLVGILWTAVVIVLDLVLYFLEAFNIGLGAYFTDVASAYLVIPLVTTLVMGYLARQAAPVPHS